MKNKLVLIFGLILVLTLSGLGYFLVVNPGKLGEIFVIGDPDEEPYPNECPEECSGSSDCAGCGENWYCRGGMCLPEPSPSPSLTPGMCGSLYICNGTYKYTCNAPTGVTAKAQVSGNSYNGGPCCITCRNGTECLEKASCDGSCTGEGGCTIKKLDCACLNTSNSCERL
ncbi:hypothetical protein COT75_02245 [Candidatus Beckwithbacteria bacterium CG10_big_fil_rev_8_21_14_0_10_34_10]|uniref:Uncharacterized protein n=1 Tax=Candidatus Beckwithbacteria bacterium CG10_big_fil_rev_8_21_14_0_10_34_10 TaxID=1974495 RepID=A0A2H0W9F9_9BACT|nr:MAG: hypothetical protein COT75_02245 [Candidatus Beckwithbacteria bacterium CG10_big_fil_rev_8_21_14_0_10_34_10]